MNELLILQYIIILFISINANILSEEFRTYPFGKIFTQESRTTCSHTISMYEDWIFAGRFIYEPNDVIELDCDVYTLEIVASYPERLSTYRIMVRVDNNDSLGNTSHTLQISDGTQLNKSLEMCNNCDQSSVTLLTSADGVIATFPAKMTNSWFLTFTAFHTGLCHSYEYMCANKRCIFHSLSCAGFDPCGDQSDCFITPAAYATIAFGGFCAIGVLFLIFYILVKSRKVSDWSSWNRQPRKFSPAKALQSVQSFTPATVSITPIQRRWSYKY